MLLNLRGIIIVNYLENFFSGSYFLNHTTLGHIVKLKKNKTIDCQVDIKLESFVCVVDRIMACERCPHPKPWNL